MSWQYAQRSAPLPRRCLPRAPARIHAVADVWVSLLDERDDHILEGCDLAGEERTGFFEAGVDDAG